MLFNFFTNRVLTNLNIKSIYLIKSAKMSTRCKVAVCQLTSTNNKENNLNIVKRLVEEAANEHAKMVFLPEACDFIATSNDEARKLSESLSGPLMTQYKEIARVNNIWLSVGGFHEKSENDTIYNAHVLINNEGTVCSVYRKIHLFDVSIPEKNLHLRESELTVAGSTIPAPVSTPAGSLALSICYDLRFPELSTLQRKLGADILTYPSAFTKTTGELHWEVLLRARAIENQCYVIAAAQYGKHNEKRTSYGQALIVDPRGQIVAECPKYSENACSDESVAFAELDAKALQEIKQSMPVFNHRRNDVYSLKLTQAKSEIKDDEIYKFADKDVLGATVFYRSEYSYAFTNIRCVVPGHVLIASLRVAKRMQDLTYDEVTDLFATAVKVQKVLEKDQKAMSTTLCVQDGEFAGQTVPHVHVHILPRREGDFDRNDDIYDCLAKHDRDDSTQPLRSSEEMIQEAKKLRAYF